MKRIGYLFGLSLFALALFTSGCEPLSASVKETVEAGVQAEVPADIVTGEQLDLYARENDVNAFSLLKSKASIVYEDGVYGIYVKNINGLEGDSAHYWALYLNDEYSQMGVKEITLNRGDKMTWKYEVIDTSVF